MCATFHRAHPRAYCMSALSLISSHLPKRTVTLLSSVRSCDVRCSKKVSGWCRRSSPPPAPPSRACHVCRVSRVPHISCFSEDHNISYVIRHTLWLYMYDDYDILRLHITTSTPNSRRPQCAVQAESETALRESSLARPLLSAAQLAHPSSRSAFMV